MVSIDYDKLNEVIGASKKLYEMVQCNLEGAKLGYSGICITPLEALMCPQIGNFEVDMDELQTQGNKALEDIQELITGIHNVINKFQESESKLEHDVKEATVSSLLLLGEGAEIQPSKGVGVSKKSRNTSSEDNNMLDTALQWGDNLGEHPIDTEMAVLGVGLGLLGVAGSGALDIFTAGTATPVSVPVALFSADSVATSFSNLIYIASGNYKKQGNFNILKGGTELGGGLIGEGGDAVAHNFGYNTNYSEKGREFGGVAFEGVNFFMGARGVSSGVGTIANKAYHLEVLENAGGKIVPNITITVNEISKFKKIGAGVSIANTSANWTKKVVSECK